MIIGMLFIIFFLVLTVLLFFMGILMKGITSISEVWRSIFGKDKPKNNPSSGYSSSGPKDTSDDDDPVLGGTSRTDLSSVKDVEFEKE